MLDRAKHLNVLGGHDADCDPVNARARLRVGACNRAHPPYQIVSCYGRDIDHHGRFSGREGRMLEVEDYGG